MTQSLYLQGASIKTLEAGIDGQVTAVKLEDGSLIEADTVMQFHYSWTIIVILVQGGLLVCYLFTGQLFLYVSLHGWKHVHFSFHFQVVIGIGAKPAVSPFESVGLNSTVGGIQVIISSQAQYFLFNFRVLTSNTICGIYKKSKYLATS